ncbi:aminobenzoyl-glutamate transporter [Virgibacillus pantothenticus]|uniref:Aminobenzoyl-glutamate transporter n=1 Tax=Virgibacillus pantothenticus TaxID=1473 RepID=A0A0L0QLB7_VIRPA|nr:MULTISPECIES: AbgT family transporter [Virgibacillus]API91565.1 aminobenzoyl-glutamate transporter [Virgibacillus sp. 6R]KNE19314.1 aminobenzoyl-glutamate transporter [Virgibacillus pantothenticus]MBS7426916.1 AbgT family transporter [Virgibacillus sp. 19R1-5]MBU8567650.1 AbgT family transporter [Virgibacillus pantothenticus]MBU8602321.1 AbgT family transporter [Virgibacillus pantothenticus]
MGKKKGIFQRSLDGVEVVGNKLPHPVTLFAILALLVLLLSAALSPLGISVEHPGEEGEMVEIKNLLNGEGINYIFSSMTDNFIGFAPLGVVLLTMLGIGIAERAGLISAILRGFVLAVPNRFITIGLVFAGIMSSVASDAGYVVLPPLGALLFAAVGRHPLAGLAAAFAGVSGGFSANLVLSGTDALLGELTIAGAAIVDPAYAEGMSIAMNWWFIAASVFLLTIIGAWVTERIVEPRLGEYKGEYREKVEKLTSLEKKGLVWAVVSIVVSLILAALLVLPEGAPMRGTGERPIIESPFMSSLVPIIAILFFIPGLVYGIVTKAVKNDKDVAYQLSDTMASMGMFIVLAFTAGQFVAYFNESNMGLVLGVYGADFLQNINLTGIPLVLVFIIIAAFINIFIGSASAKWAMMAPIFVPIMMQLGYSPELTQMAYRIADSSTNIISPLMTYFAIIIAFAQKYDKKMGIGTLVSTMIPYSIFFLVGWTLMLIVWMLFGVELGPGAPILYE